MAARRLPLKSDYRFYFHQDKGRSTSVDKDVFSPHLDRVAIDSHGRVLLHLPGRDVVFPAMPGASHDGSVQDSDRKSTRLNSSHTVISYAVFCLKKKKKKEWKALVHQIDTFSQEYNDLAG